MPQARCDTMRHYKAKIRFDDKWKYYDVYARNKDVAEQLLRKKLCSRKPDEIIIKWVPKTCGVKRKKRKRCSCPR